LRKRAIEEENSSSIIILTFKEVRVKSAIVFVLIWCGAAAAQQQQGAKPTFEVARVRMIDPNNSVLVGMSSDPALISYRNLTLRDAIRGAYMVRDFQIVGPDWMSTVRFQVDAKMPAGASSEQVPLMFQSLLEERFGLTWRREPKEMQVYSLVAGKDGPKLKEAQPVPAGETLAMGTDGKPRAMVGFGGNANSVTVFAPSASLLTLVGVTSRFTGKPLVDDTGIRGEYNFTLTFAPEVTTGPGIGPGNPAGPSDPAPTLADAVKQYGLRVETKKAAVDMFVVTHAEKTATEN
jgi:uncharacterized protein (TIGR03435 family)